MSYTLITLSYGNYFHSNNRGYVQSYDDSTGDPAPFYKDPEGISKYENPLYFLNSSQLPKLYTDPTIETYTIKLYDSNDVFIGSFTVFSTTGFNNLILNGKIQSRVPSTKILMELNELRKWQFDHINSFFIVEADIINKDSFKRIPDFYIMCMDTINIYGICLDEMILKKTFDELLEKDIIRKGTMYYKEKHIKRGLIEINEMDPRNLKSLSRNGVTLNAYEKIGYTIHYEEELRRILNY